MIIGLFLYVTPSHDWILSSYEQIICTIQIDSCKHGVLMHPWQSSLSFGSDDRRISYPGWVPVIRLLVSRSVTSLLLASHWVCFDSVPSVEAEKNMQDVLANYEESPDTTYESGDHAAIAAAAVQESSAAVLDTLQSAAEQLHVSGRWSACARLIAWLKPLKILSRWITCIQTLMQWHIFLC